MWQTLLDYATIATGLAAAASVVYLALQIKVTVDEARIQRSHTFITRYNDPVWGKMMFSARALLRDKSTYDKIFDLDGRHQETVTARQTITIALNFFEEMGELYNRGMLNQELIEDFFSYISKDYYESANDFIEFGIGHTGIQRVYEEWRIMNESFRNKGLWEGLDSAQ